MQAVPSLVQLVLVKRKKESPQQLPASQANQILKEKQQRKKRKKQRKKQPVKAVELETSNSAVALIFYCRSRIRFFSQMS